LIIWLMVDGEFDCSFVCIKLSNSIHR